MRSKDFKPPTSLTSLCRSVQCCQVYILNRRSQVAWWFLTDLQQWSAMYELPSFGRGGGGVQQEIKSLSGVFFAGTLLSWNWKKKPESRQKHSSKSISPEIQFEANRCNPFLGRSYAYMRDEPKIGYFSSCSPQVSAMLCPTRQHCADETRFCLQICPTHTTHVTVSFFRV
jgi:hypothetical protein